MIPFSEPEGIDRKDEMVSMDKENKRGNETDRSMVEGSFSGKAIGPEEEEKSLNIEYFLFPFSLLFLLSWHTRS